MKHGEERGLKHAFASPSIMTWFHPSIIASCTAQRIAFASTWRDEHEIWVFAQTFMTSPLSSLATASSKKEELSNAASTFILIQPVGDEKNKERVPKYLEVSVTENPILLKNWLHRMVYIDDIRGRVSYNKLSLGLNPITGVISLL